MAIHTAHRHSIFCILPPHMLEALAQQGSPRQRDRALRTLSMDQTFRALRAQNLATPSPQARGAGLAVASHKQRTIFDAKHSQNLPGTVVRSEGGATGADLTVNEAYDGLGATYDFYWNVFERNSIDDNGLPLNATVHFDEDFDNAFWDGQRMVFGDGDGEIFTRFTASLDVIGHELTHGVTEDESQLIYFMQSGALNESLSDVFGSLVKQYLLKQTAAQADWLIGAELLTDSVQGIALRSMKAPGTAYNDPRLGKDPQPDHMSKFVHTFRDNGGVHINSGIPNKAFYLVATKIGGQAWEKAGRIWYVTLRDSRLRPNSGFLRFGRLTLDNARRLYGRTSSEQSAVRTAWHEVGIELV